jgi:hypothetical protein
MGDDEVYEMIGKNRNSKPPGPRKVEKLLPVAERHQRIRSL